MIDLLLLVSVPVLFSICRTRPDRFLLAWLFMSAFAPDMLVIFGLNLRIVSFDRLAFLASALALISNGQFRELFPDRFSKLEKAYLVFAVMFLLEAILKFAPRDVISVWTNALDTYLLPFYFYLFAKYLLTRDGKYNDDLERRIILTLAILGGICAAMSIFEGLTGIDLLGDPDGNGLRDAEDEGGRRTNGPFWCPGVLGQYLSWTTLLVMYRWRLAKLTSIAKPALRPVSKLITLPYTVLMSAGMYFVMFRNIWGGFLGGYAIRYLFSRKARFTFIFAVILLALGITVGWQQIATTRLYRDRISNMENVYDRLGAWLYAFRAFSEHPLTGIGTQGMKQYIRGAQAEGDDLRVMDIPATYHPHNSILALMAENGLLALVPFCLAIWYFLRQVRDCVRLGRSPADIEFGIFAVSIAFAIYAPSFTDRNLEYNKLNNLLWLIFALVAARRAKLMGALGRTSVAASEPALAAVVPEITHVAG
jgi:hypothetical protein